MPSPYGSSDEEKHLLPRNNEAKGRNGGSSQSSLTSTTILTLILLALCYLIFLVHDILHELQGSNAGVRSWQHFSSENLIQVNRLSSSGKLLSDRTQGVVILIVYGPHDDDGQKLMASQVAKGAESVENTVVIQESIATASFEQVLQADAVILGASVENANTHHKVQAWINENWDVGQDLSNKVGGAFVTAGGISAGEEGTLHRLLESMMIFRMIVVGGNDWKSAFGASAITFEAPFTSRQGDQLEFPEVCYQQPGELIHPIFLSKAYGLGVRVATVAQRLKSPKCS